MRDALFQWKPCSGEFSLKVNSFWKLPGIWQGLPVSLSSSLMFKARMTLFAELQCHSAFTKLPSYLQHGSKQKSEWYKSLLAFMLQIFLLKKSLQLNQVFNTIASISESYSGLLLFFFVFFFCGRKCKSDDFHAPGMILIKKYLSFSFSGKNGFHFFGLNN